MPKRTDIQMFAEVLDEEGIWTFAEGPNEPWFYYNNEKLIFPILRGVGEAYDLPRLPEPRGFPTDASWALMRKYTVPAAEAQYTDIELSFPNEERGPNPHYSNASWLSAEEIVKTDWNTPIRRKGFVNPEGYRIFKETGKPPDLYGQVQGAGVVQITNRAMDRRIKSNDWTPTKKEEQTLRRRKKVITASLKEKFGASEDLADVLSEDDLGDAVDVKPDFYTEIVVEEHLWEKIPEFVAAIEAVRNLGNSRAVYWMTK